MSEILLACLRMSTPLIFAAMGGLLSEKSGVINIALEGFMLVGAFSAAVTSHYAHSAWLGWMIAFVIGCSWAATYALFVIEFKADQIITGTALNLLAVGVAPFVTKILFNSTGSTPALEMDSRFSFEPVLISFILVMLITFWINRIRSGLWLQFAGEHPEALATSGVSPRKIRWFAVLLSGGFAAWGGASLSLFLASAYSPLMTGGRGFMALAALIFGKWKPIPTMVACLFFGLTDAIQIRLQGVPIGGIEIPVQFIQILPYIVTIIALAGFIGTSRPPKALGRPL